MEEVVLVDELDQEIGTMEKIEAHRKGALHRAFSILLFNSKGEVLLQKRALTKYHSAGLWTNTCCSHPKPGESMQNAVRRKLMHEMGIAPNHPNIFFSQLYGMGDNISYVLAKSGFNVSKYVPYGPVADAVPYLIRRAEENSSAAGQVSRELEMIGRELKRRRVA